MEPKRRRKRRMVRSAVSKHSVADMVHYNLTYTLEFVSSHHNPTDLDEFAEKFRKLFGRAFVEADQSFYVLEAQLALEASSNEDPKQAGS